MVRRYLKDDDRIVVEKSQPKVDPKHSDGRQTWNPLVVDPTTKSEHPVPQSPEPNFERF